MNILKAIKSIKSPGARVAASLLLIFIATGCGGHHTHPTPQRYYKPVVIEKKKMDETGYATQLGAFSKIEEMGYTIQVGAFSKIENAVGLVNHLNGDNLDAYYFMYGKKLYKVRFGNFESRELACKEAEILRVMGVIGEFYIVRPDEYSISKKQKRGEAYIRSEMVKTAQTFIGIPYKWGGSSAGDGFDCSGLVMAIYRLNGLKLPRTSFEQYKSGTYIDGKGPSKGDLVFFDTRGIGRVSHVGIYVGEGKFIHAPRTGKNVRTSSLSAKYYKDRYMGARTYL